MSLINIDHVTKEYISGEETVRAVNDITLQIDEGEFVAVTGASGSGKSTLLSVLGGLNHPTRGKAIVDDIDVYSLTHERLADFRSEYLGFVFQSFNLIPYLTVLENVMLPLTITHLSNADQTGFAVSILEKVGLTEKAHRLPDELSGGEQERVAIARGLVNHPPILLADEPTGNLDTATGAGVMKLFQQLSNEGQTIVMVTHNPANMKFACRCVTLRDGRLDN